MKYLSRIIIAALILTGLSVNAQAQKADHELVQAAIEQLFEGMAEADTSKIAAVFTGDAIMQTIGMDQQGNVQVRNGSLSQFLSSIAGQEKNRLNEKILSYNIQTDGPMAHAWTPYEFYVGTEFSHCGVNSFQMVKQDGSWKINYIIDTRRREGCQD